MNQPQVLQSDKKEIFKEITANADRFITNSLLAYFVLGIGLSFFYGTYLVGIAVGGLCLVAFFGTRMLLPNSDLYQYVLGGVLAIFTAQFIYQMHGLFEMHFFVFVSSTLLIAYQNWKLQLPLILLVVVHHALFAFLQYSGNTGIYFTQLAYMDLLTFMIHGGLAAVIVGVCGWWSFQFEKRTIAAYHNSSKLEQQLQSVSKNIVFAEEISKGNLDYKNDSVDQSDELGNALLKMQQSIAISTKREQEEKFVTMGINKISEILRGNSSNVKVLSEELIKGLVKYMKLNQGGIFLLEGESADQHLELTACYAFERKKFLEKRIELGEGLIGQCFLERDIIYLKDVPKHYVRITSGLGDAPPSCVLIAPIQTQDEIVGVLELASLYDINESTIEFVKKICQSIASSIVSTKITERVQKLLSESQQQGEELRAQEEEVRQNMEELSATQEVMERKENEMQERMLEMKVNEEDMQKVEKKYRQLTIDHQNLLKTLADSQENSIDHQNLLKTLAGSKEHIVEKFHETI
jgi:methyl-accepting chemotaxis protein